MQVKKSYAPLHFSETNLREMEREAYDHLQSDRVYTGFLNVLYESINEVGRALFPDDWVDYTLLPDD